MAHLKNLYVIRHAKSSWDDSDLPDSERPLNERGKRDAPRMGKRLKERDVHPDLIISSPANRALATAMAIADILNYRRNLIVQEKKLYHASEDQILSIIRKTDDRHRTVLLFGHNPGLTDFVNALSADDPVTDNVPTCGVVAFEANIVSWNDLRFEEARLLFFDYPRSRDD